MEVENMTNFPNDYTDFNNEAAELLEKQSPLPMTPRRNDKKIELMNKYSKPEIISYSEVFKWDTCQRQYHYRFNLGLSPIEESEAITTGTKGHKLLQSIYEEMQKGLSKEEALKLTQDRASKQINEGRFPDFGLLKAWTLVDNYVRANSFDTEAVLVENRFLFPFANLNKDPDFSDVQIGFTPDVVFKRTGNWYDVEDSKFVQKAWSKAKLNRFQQAKLYQFMLLQMGYSVSTSRIRFFNVTTGDISVQNYSYNKEEEKNLLHDFTEGIKEVIRYRRLSAEERLRARRTMNYSTCQFCAFETPCTLEAEGKSAEKTLKNQFKPSEYSYES